MISVRKAGFTIIEVMLFLGISGLLFVGIIAGTSGSINVQRYHDSVTSLQSVLQQQYSEASNVINDSTTSLRGQSESVVLGRFVTTTDGTNLTLKSVIGVPTNVLTNPTDISTFKDGYTMDVSDINSSTYSIEWGAVLSDVSGSTPKGFSMLVLRSPLSGITRTFLSDAPTADDDNHLSIFLASLITQPNLDKSIQLCVDSQGLFTGPKLAVKIDANSSSASGIQTLGEAEQALTDKGNSVCH